MTVQIQVKPNARKVGVEILPDGSLKVAVNAPPQEGKANKAVIEVLADYYSVPKSSIRIVMGQKGKKKSSRGEGVSMDKFVGAWHLRSFDISKNGEDPAPWGSDIHGRIVYTADGTVSVAMNKAIEEPRKDSRNVLASLNFYAGTYRVEGDTMIHTVTEASAPSRIGKELRRTFELSGDTLTFLGRVFNYLKVFTI